MTLLVMKIDPFRFSVLTRALPRTTNDFRSQVVLWVENGSGRNSDQKNTILVPFLTCRDFASVQRSLRFGGINS
jgi:hypothetical protein